MNAASLFSGIEGFGLALERTGIPTAAAVEYDQAARGVIADRLPDTTLLTDVREVTGDDLRAAGFVPDTGVLTAGWPCQGNSVAGLRGGMDDPRSGLWREVVRLLAETRPRWFIGENVPGLLSIGDGRDFRTVVRDLDELGYGVAWRVLDAQHFGVPQRRRRVFVVGCLGDGAAPVQVLLEPEGSDRNPAARRTEGARVAATLTSGSHHSRQPGRRSEDDVNLIASTVRRPDKGPDSDATDTLIVSALTASDGGADDNLAQANHVVAFDAAQITSAENRVNPQPGDPAMPLAATGQPMVATSLAVAGDFSHGEDVAQTVRSANGQPGTVLAPTLTAGMGSNVGHPGDAGKDDTIPAVAEASVAVRRLTPLECERLQGFPDGWTTSSWGKPQSDSARYRQLGNAVAVPVVEWIARRLVAADLERAA